MVSFSLKSMHCYLIKPVIKLVQVLDSIPLTMANLQVVHLTSGWVDCYSDGDFVATVHLLTEDFNIFSENSQRRFAIYQVRYKSININS